MPLRHRLSRVLIMVALTLMLIAGTYGLGFWATRLEQPFRSTLIAVPSGHVALTIFPGRSEITLWWAGENDRFMQRMLTLTFPQSKSVSEPHPAPTPPILPRLGKERIS